MKSKQTITIGIPAYNEEQNIGNLINSLKRQKLFECKIEKIIISSDGSTDKTVSIVKNMKDKSIEVIENKKRRGKFYGINQILSCASSDILILLDADVLIRDFQFLEKLTRPIRLVDADLTSAKIQEQKPHNFFESILKVSMIMKKKIYESLNSGDNIYTCFGRAIAFSKRLYTKISFPKEIISDDAYAYLYCISHGFIYNYVNTTEIFYRLPGSIADHTKQSVRFFSTQKQLYRIFGERFVKKEYKISPFLAIQAAALNFLSHPFFMTLYVIVLFYMKLLSLFRTAETRWEIAKSSKLIV